MKLALAWDDVQIVPKYSEISSRDNVQLCAKFTEHFDIKLPFVAAPMDTVCAVDMAFALYQAGGV